MNFSARPSVYHDDGDGHLNEIPFSECIVELLQNADERNELFASVKYSYKNGMFILSSSSSSDCHIKLHHPPQCPLMLLRGTMEKKLGKNVSLGVAVLLQSSDEYVLITRRSKHLRLFPGLWVPPGGHAEHGETLVQTGVRELQEETGVWLTEREYQSFELCLFESCYPARREWGNPSGHHVVVYLLLQSSITKDDLDKRIQLHEDEVDACAWLSKTCIKAFCEGKPVPQNIAQRNVTSGKVWTSELDPSIFEVVVKKTERISTGCHLALTTNYQRYDEKTD